MSVGHHVEMRQSMNLLLGLKCIDRPSIQTAKLAGKAAGKFKKRAVIAKERTSERCTL